jgi:hypothetical protein
VRLIDADALIQKRNHAKAYAPDMHVIGQGYVMDAPTIEAVPVVRGEWTTNSDYPDTVICSLCGWRESVWWADKGTNYCPNCGAKMVE